ncbi:MAG: hypothetical protein NW220_09225 [Leptolyngbyaceae cyanobacterium bins.349]|nr:hypothetical protein [Leptolyngbyaceae cyanobacterium bins.349]
MLEAKSDLVESAKEGNPKALEILMNRQLQPRGVTAAVSFKDGCLRVTLTSDQLIEPKSSIEFILNGLLRLQVDRIKKIQVYARKSERKAADWIEVYELQSLDGKILRPEIKTSPIKKFRVSSKKRKHILLKQLLTSKRFRLITIIVVTLFALICTPLVLALVI